MRREAESVFAHTIYHKLTVKADPRLLAAFGGQDGTWAKALEEKSGGTILLEGAEMGFGQYVMEKEK